jgi:NTP pyrophosphatase (non-canonical NTP hydrolase)
MGNRVTYSLIKWIAMYYGLEAQLNQTSEELAELVVAINKYRRKGEEARQNLVEEIADVEIMIYQIKYLLGIDEDDILKIKSEKAQRQVKRIRENEDEI